MVEPFTLADKEKAVEDFMDTLGLALAQAMADYIDREMMREIIEEMKDMVLNRACDKLI